MCFSYIWVLNRILSSIFHYNRFLGMCSKIVVHMEAFMEMFLNQFLNKVLIILIHIITFSLFKIINILKLMLHYIFSHFVSYFAFVLCL